MIFAAFVFGKTMELDTRNPDYEGGANEVSLKQAQQNFIKFGACDEGSISL